MSNRVWMHQTLANNAGVQALVGDRVIPAENFHRRPEIAPFIVDRLGNASPDNVLNLAERQYFTIYCHDESSPGEYTRIDDIVSAVKKAFRDAGPAPEDHILEARYLETSPDLDDREMGTVLRYVRFQIINSQHT